MGNSMEERIDTVIKSHWFMMFMLIDQKAGLFVVLNNFLK